MFVNAIKKVEKAMFPIFRTEPIQGNHFHSAIVGTGFFIGRDGMFASLAHVFDGKTPKTQFQFFGFLPEGIRSMPLEILEAARNDSHDIFIGKIALSTPEFILLSNGVVDVGKSVCIGGYAGLALPDDEKGKTNIMSGRRYYQPSFVVDYFTSQVCNEHGVTRTHDGFLLRDLGLRGMSGGPVFDVDGTALGIFGGNTAKIKL